MRKPRTAGGYDPGQVQHVQATCPYVATKLGDLADAPRRRGCRDRPDSLGEDFAEVDSVGPMRYAESLSSGRLREHVDLAATAEACATGVPHGGGVRWRHQRADSLRWRRRDGGPRVFHRRAGPQLYRVQALPRWRRGLRGVGQLEHFGAHRPCDALQLKARARRPAVQAPAPEPAHAEPTLET